ncbi:MAG TPA: DHH family phosphoesterase [Kofleriaceae bacterium]|nr:DHH family phosphoesterase [Kofleriaceae bacterium]
MTERSPKEGLSELTERLAAASRVLVTCHLGPDGDALGSMIALAAILGAQGKAVTLYNPDLVPRHLKWMPLSRSLVHRLKGNPKFDATVVVDCGDVRLLGDSFPKHEITGDVLVLDHHASVRPFGDLYVCDPSAASVGVLVYRIAREADWGIPPEAAMGIYVSIVSDTGSFRYANTNAEALTIAADLVAAGHVTPWEVSERMNERSPLSRYKLLSRVLGDLETTAEGKLAFMTITHEMVAAAKAKWEDTEGFVGFARSIRGVECGVLLSPAKRGGVRVSMRSKGHLIDAGAVCTALGGGGHRGAAGCTLKGDDLAAARVQVEAALAAALAAAHDPPADRA